MEPTMSRRQFLKLAAGTMAGTATAELAGLGFPTVYARPPAQRIKQGKEVPSVCVTRLKI
ncbi:MAG: twin-arginine translocation signal domain-containing protein [Chloroflexi bacterium]|nr:twin-arginine translocation signal domain-containing protein [Chloroflexota bacterium]